MTYAAELTPDGIVIRVIVGDHQWATANLGGRWVGAEKYDDTQTYPGIGFGYAGNHPRRFAPVAPPGLEKADDEDDAIPPDSLWWDNGQIDNIETIAARRGVLTAQEAAENRPVRDKGRPDV
jgi:hypothetical protein